MIEDIRKEIKKLADPKRAKANEWFFKTGIGQYGEGDRFIGLTVPQCRSIAKSFKAIGFSDISRLLTSKIHEERMIALLVLVENFQKGNEELRKEIFDFYLRNTEFINNWDLVDLSADKIVGGFLLDKNRNMLKKLAKSKQLWEKRISIIATFQFIKDKQEYKDTLEIAEILINDTHDLIQKAVGWMLREVGKRASEKELVIFLSKHYKKMPRTALRYAIERFPKDIREKYLKGVA